MSDSPLTAIIDLDHVCFPNEAWSEKVWNERENSTFSHILSLSEENIVVGVIVFTHISDESEILKIFVSPSYRGKGVAKRLIQMMEAYLEKTPVKHCFLEVRCNNTAAVHLYQNLGYTKVGLRKNYYRNPVCDALLFRKSLRNPN